MESRPPGRGAGRDGLVEQAHPGRACLLAGCGRERGAGRCMTSLPGRGTLHSRSATTGFAGLSPGTRQLNGGHGTEPQEKKTQQSSGFGFSIVPQAVHSK